MRKSMPLVETWSALTAQVKAFDNNRPLVTQVELGVWMVYPPHEGVPVIGGILTKEKAILVAEKNYGITPIVSDRVFVLCKGKNPLPPKREGDYFASEVALLLKNQPILEESEEDEDDE
jgi:hypothetical protein